MSSFWESGQWHWCWAVGSCYISWADHWQTMIAGAAAIGAAYYAGRLANKQIKAARGQIAVTRAQIDADQKRADLDRSAKLRAARSSLPATLSAICNYAEAATRSLDERWPVAQTLYPNDFTATHIFAVQITVPIFPTTTIPVLERVVELTSDEPVAERIESLLREVQVFEARCRKLHEGERVVSITYAGYILEAATVYARAASLYDFARRHSETINAEPLWDEVFSALTISGVVRNEVLALARSERDQGLPPGEADTRR